MHITKLFQDGAMNSLGRIALLMLPLFSCCVDAQQADLVLRGGKIVTLDSARPQAAALAAKDGRIIAVGDERDIEPLIGENTRILDLEGALAIPGFIEGHGHLKGIGYAQMNLDLMHAANWSEIVAKVKDAAEAVAPGEWIVGRGWHQEKWDPPASPNVAGYPLHHSLSEVSPNHPVMLTHASGHALFANAKAMELAGVDKETQDPAGGKILRDDTGEPIGVFEENAEELIQNAMRLSGQNRTADQKKALEKRALSLAVEECLSKGITSFTDAGSSFDDLDLYKEMADEGSLGIRLWVMAGEGNDRLRAKLSGYKLNGYGDHHLTLGGIKRYIDGALGSRGAWLLAPYDDLPSSTGQNVLSLEALRESAEIALEHGLQLCTHAIGDRGNREILDIYRDALKGSDKRWRIEHAQHLSLQDIPRFAELHVIASMQGVHCTSDAPFVVKRLGERRAEEGAYVWKKLLESGAIVCNGTDAPVEDVDPLACLYATVTRRLKDGSAFFPDQKLSVMQALKTYTLSNAYATYQEEIKGSLVPGKLADITVLSRDITAIDPSEIPKTEVRYTIVGGEIKYQRPK